MELVDLPTARALQELGYDGKCYRWYSRECTLKATNLVDDDVPAPRLDDAAYFLRDRYNIHIVMEYVCGNGNGWEYTIVRDYDSQPKLTLSYGKDTYDDALETAVKQAIEIIKYDRHGTE